MSASSASSLAAMDDALCPSPISIAAPLSLFRGRRRMNESEEEEEERAALAIRESCMHFVKGPMPRHDGERKRRTGSIEEGSF